MKKNIQWLIPVLTCIVASVASVFLPVLTYLYPDGQKGSFNIIDFAEPSREFLDILASYSGPNEVYIPQGWLTVLALVGIIGTAIPAILIFIAAPVSRQYLPGIFRIGVYPIITPIAMVMCMITVTKKHKKTQAELRAAERAKGLIRRGGDL